MQAKRDVSHMVGHAYFRGTEERHEKGTGLELALDEMEARRRKSKALRTARPAMMADEAKAED